jgi:DNA polymerase III delta subunit
MTSPAVVTLLWGEDPYLLRERALELVGDCRPTEVDANEWRGSELQDLATASLFAEPASRGLFGCSKGWSWPA